MKKKWQDAADQLRIPYWDWATNPNMPDVVSQQTVQITNSAGQIQQVNNPFYAYNFQNMPMNQTWFPQNTPDGWLSKYPQTMRGLSTENGQSDPGLCNAYMNFYGLKQSTVSAVLKHNLCLLILIVVRSH